VFPHPGKKSGLWSQVAFYSSLGFILPAGAVGGYFLGWALDGWLHTRPVLAILLTMLGAAGGFVEVLRILSRAEKSAGGNNSGSGASPS